MPRISAFYGITIWMYWKDHPPPHFHVRYGDDWAQLQIGSGRILEGELPFRVLRLVRDWERLQRQELQTDWQLAQRQAPLAPIPPLA